MKWRNHNLNYIESYNQGRHWLAQKQLREEPDLSTTSSVDCEASIGEDNVKELKESGQNS